MGAAALLSAGAVLAAPAADAAAPVGVTDLAVAVNAPTSLPAGGRAQASVKITNNGPASSSSSLVGLVPSGPLVISDAGGGGAIGPLVFFVAPTLEPGASATYTVTIGVNAVGGGSSTLTAGVVPALLADPNYGNNIASATVTSGAMDGLDIMTGTFQGYTRVGPDLYEVDPRYPVTLNYWWTATKSGEQLIGSECQVESSVSGPGGYFTSNRTAHCSTTFYSSMDMPNVRAPGTYTITVSVVPPGGGAPIVKTKNLTVVPK